MNITITDHVVVPVANKEDARTTAQLLEPYSVGDITVLHVVEKGGGVPDKSPVEQSEQIAEDAFEAFHETFPDAGTEVTYRRDVVQGIINVAEKVDASAILFCPRGGARILQFLAGDRSLRLIMEANRPVIALPEREDDQ
ncbi:universal stress protein [Halogeometricum borinquense]|uniref:universal stress protein n=1 Tax=Halogeometricum borinquense TaxID=60847 RepID=UPI00341DF4E7